MKKYCAVGLVALSVLPWMAKADSNITISGNVVASPCTVDTDTQNKLVELGSMQKRDLTQAGDGGAWKDFTLLVKDCPAGTGKVTATYTGLADNQDGSGWKNSGTASNVALHVTSPDHSQTISNGTQQQVNVNTATQSASFPLSARMYTPQGNAQAGTFSSVINVEFTWQ